MSNNFPSISQNHFFFLNKKHFLKEGTSANVLFKYIKWGYSKKNTADFWEEKFLKGRKRVHTHMSTCGLYIFVLAPRHYYQYKYNTNPKTNQYHLLMECCCVRHSLKAHLNFYISVFQLFLLQDRPCSELFQLLTVKYQCMYCTFEISLLSPTSVCLFLCILFSSRLGMSTVLYIEQEVIFHSCGIYIQLQQCTAENAGFCNNVIFSNALQVPNVFQLFQQDLFNKYASSKGSSGYLCLFIPVRRGSFSVLFCTCSLHDF